MTVDRHDDLPLFRWSPPACQVIAFPTTKRIGKIRRTAQILSEKSGKAADRYWQQVVGGMRSQMTTAGIPEGEIEAELRAFFAAVQIEMVRLGHSGLGSGGGAA